MDGKTTDKLLDEWHASAGDAIDVLKDFQYLMKKWQGSPPNNNEFMDMLRVMRNNGLECWLDRHPLGLDRFAEALEVDE